MRKAFVYTALIVFADTLGLGADSTLLGKSLFHYFTMLTLAQAAILFVLGGAFDVTGSLSFANIVDHLTKTHSPWSTETHRKAQSKAVPFVVAGIFLLALSFALAYPLN